MCTQTITRSTASYNRTKKCYQVITPWGEITHEFPSGPRGKRDAERETIRIDSPEAYAAAADLRFNVFSDYPEVYERIWKAARIVADHGIYSAHPLGSHKEGYHVASQSTDGKFYDVHRDAESSLYTCNCTDFEMMHAPTIKQQQLCKHIIGVKVAKMIGQVMPEYSGSPRDLWPHLAETGAIYTVIGAYNRRPYLYNQPQQRKATAGEIVEDHEGNTWRLIDNGQRLNAWRIGLPEIEQPATTGAAIATNNDAAPQASRYEGLDAIEAQRLYQKRQSLSKHNHDLKELQRQQVEKNAVKAYEQRKSAAVNADLFG